MNIRAHIRSNIHFRQDGITPYFDTIYPIEVHTVIRDGVVYVEVIDTLAADYDEIREIGTGFVKNQGDETDYQASLRGKAADIIAKSRFYRPGYAPTPDEQAWIDYRASGSRY